MSVNKVILVGNLGKDPELKYTPSGDAVVNFPLATSERYKDKSGQAQEKTEWHSIVMWRQLAEIAGKYLHKGKQIYIEGKLQTRKWQDKNGVDRYTTEIVASTMQMLGGGNGQQQRQPGQSNSEGYASGGRAYGSGQQSAPQDGQPTFNPDDEIPF